MVPSEAPTLDVKDPAALISGVKTAYTVAKDAVEESSAQLMDVETLKSMANPAVLTDRGLLKLDTLKIFFSGLLPPLHVESWTAPVLGDYVLGFILLNAAAFWVELLGYLAGYMYGVVSAFGLFDGVEFGVTMSLVFIIIEVLVALIVSYTLYWMVLYADVNGNLYQLLAVGVYLVFGLFNVFYALGCLVGGIEFLRLVFYTVEAHLALGCAFYALQMRAVDKKTGPPSNMELV